MKNNFILILLAILAFSFTNYKKKNTESLTFLLGNFENDNGQAIIQLFKKGDAMPKNPSWKGNSKIVNGKATITFNAIPYGDYAAILFHDENSNGILDHSFGMPAESMGFSNGWELSLFSGMPNFSKLKFEFSEQKRRCSINIK